jgi:hypothetical protein
MGLPCPWPCGLLFKLRAFVADREHHEHPCSRTGELERGGYCSKDAAGVRAACERRLRSRPSRRISDTSGDAQGLSRGRREDFGGGRTVYHCHILDHEDRGMTGTVLAN